MSLTLTQPPDYVTLPTDLLATAKAHCRIDFARDDALLTSLIARAIARFERELEVSVFAAEYTWTPAVSDFDCNGVATVPVTPIRSSSTALVTDGAPYAIQIYKLTGGYVDGVTVTLQTGFVDAASLHPGILDPILQIVDFSYENRSLLVANGQVLVPNWLTEQLAGWWKPKC